MLLVYILYIYNKSHRTAEQYLSERDVPIVIKARVKPNKKSNIPYDVYQCWHTVHIPAGMRKTIHENVKANPEFNFHFYNDAACRKFLSKHFSSDVVKAYDALKPSAYKADLWRLCIIYKYGGIYMDAKFKIANPSEFKKCVETTGLYVQDLGENRVYNGFFCAKAGNAILKKCINDIIHNVTSRYYGNGSLDITGPVLVGRNLLKTNNDEVKYRLVTMPDINNNNIFYIVDKLSGDLILQSYDKYRKEQDRSGTPHYHYLWKQKDIYNDADAF